MTPQNFRSRTVRRPALVAALALAAAFTAAPGEGPRVESASGQVEIASGEPAAWRAVRPGEPIAPGDAVRTGHDGRAELVLGTGTVRLYPNSLLRVPLLGSGRGASEKVRLEEGRSLFDVLKRRDGVFEVETPEVVVSVKGTRFGVDVSASLAQVAVFRGLVGVRELSQTLAMETLVREGFAAVGGSERAFELMLNAAPDPWDGWSAGRVETLLENRSNLPTLSPSALKAAPPAKLAVAEARMAAHEATRPQVTEIALERSPELRKRVTAMVEKKRAQRGGNASGMPPEPIERDDLSDRDFGRDGLSDPSFERDDLPTLSRDDLDLDLDVADDLAVDVEAMRDAVADSQELRQEIQASLVESIVVGTPVGMPGGGGGSGSGTTPFSVQLLGDEIEVIAGGTTFLFDDDDLEDLIASGGAGLPGPLLAFLETNGVSGPELLDVLTQLAVLLDD